MHKAISKGFFENRRQLERFIMREKIETTLKNEDIAVLAGVSISTLERILRKRMKSIRLAACKSPLVV